MSLESQQKEVQDLQTEVAVIKRDINQFGVLFTKLDLTIEKIGDVSNNISRLLAVHEERLDVLHSMDKDLEHKIVKHKDDIAKDVKELHSRITTSNREMLDAINAVEKNIKHHIDNEHSRQDTELKELENKISALEKWKWIVIGGSMAFGWVISNLFPLIK